MRASKLTSVPSGSARVPHPDARRVAVHVAEERLLAGVDHLHRPAGVQREQARVDVQAHVLAGAERAADAAEREPHQLGRRARGTRRPGRGRCAATACDTTRSTPPSSVGDGEAGLGAHERLVLHADLVGALDDDRTARVGVAAADDEVAEHVAVGVQRRRVDRELGVDERLEHFVVDDDRRARAPRGLGMVGGDHRDRLAHVAHDVVGEHRLVAVLEAVAVRPGTSSAVSTACTPAIASAGPMSMRADAGRRVRRAQRLAPQHALGPQVAGERELAPHLGDAVGPDRALADAARVTSGVDVRVTTLTSRPPSASTATLRPLRGCGRSRCSGTGCPRSPRAPRGRRAR